MSGGRRYRQGNAVRNSVETLASSSTQSQEERRSIDPADKDIICTNRSPHGMPARDRFESLNTGQQSLPHVSQDGHTTAGGAFIAPIYDTWNGANKVTFADSHLFVASLAHDGTRTDHESTPMDTSSSFSHSSLSSRRRAWPSADPVCSQHYTETRDRKTWVSFKLHWPTDIPGYNGRRGGHSLPRGEGIGQRRSLVQYIELKVPGESPGADFEVNAETNSSSTYTYEVRCEQPSHSTLSRLYEANIELFDTEGQPSAYCALPTATVPPHNDSASKTTNRWRIMQRATHAANGLAQQPHTAQDYSSRVFWTDAVFSSVATTGSRGQKYLVRDESSCTPWSQSTMRISVKSNRRESGYLDLGYFACESLVLHLDLHRMNQSKTDIEFVVILLETWFAMRDEDMGNGSHRRDDRGRLKSDSTVVRRLFDR
ncbi:unnamed protein product [Jaminaea pallidilutea]